MTVASEKALVCGTCSVKFTATNITNGIINNAIMSLCITTYIPPPHTASCSTEKPLCNHVEDAERGLAEVPGPFGPLHTPPHPALICVPTLRWPPPPPSREAAGRKELLCPSPQQDIQKSAAWTIALSFLFPKRDQPWGPSERAVITSSFVGNGINMAHGRALGQQWGLAGLSLVVMGWKNCSRLPSPSLLPGSRHWGGGRRRDQKMELAPSQSMEGWPAPLAPPSLAKQGSPGPETPEIALWE